MQNRFKVLISDLNKTHKYLHLSGLLKKKKSADRTINNKSNKIDAFRLIYEWKIVKTSYIMNMFHTTVFCIT